MSGRRSNTRSHREGYQDATIAPDEYAGVKQSGWKNFWDKVLGRGLTDADKEANQFTASMAEQAWDKEVAFYEKYESFDAQVDAFQRNGLNPFSFNGAPGSGPAYNSASSVSPSSGSMPNMAGDLSTLASSLMSAIGLSADVKLKNSERDLNEAQAEQVRKESGRYDELTDAKIAEMRSNVSLNSARVTEVMNQASKHLSDIAKNEGELRLIDKQIQVGDSVIALNGSQKEFNITSAALNKMKAKEINELLPYVKARHDAAIALDQAKTYESYRNAEKLMYDANKSMLDVLKESDLINQGYYDELVAQMRHQTEEAKWDAAMSKREYKWKPVNDVCSNLSKVVIAASTAVSAATGAASLGGAAGAVQHVSAASLTFF